MSDYKDIIYINDRINTLEPYYFMYNGQKYNAAYYNGHPIFGIKRVFNDFLYFEAIDTCQIGWYKKSEKLLYSYDRLTWQQFPYVPASVVYIPGGDYPDEYFITLNAGDKIYVKGTDNVLTSYENGQIDQYCFIQKGNGKLKCGGDLTFLYADPGILAGATYDLNTYKMNTYGMYQLFWGMNIVSAPRMPHLILNDGTEYTDIVISEKSFMKMFYGCQYLIKSPTIYNYSHLSVSDVYQEMFYNCSSLNQITYLDDEGPNTADSLNWVTGVAANGTFYSTEMKTYSADSGVPLNWTRVII